LKAGLSNRPLGEIGVFNTVPALFRHGYNVLAPLEDFTRYDLVTEKNGVFKRLQVKTTSKIQKTETKYRFTLACGSGKKVPYKHKNIDYIVCYAADINKFWLLKTKDCKVITQKLSGKTGSDWTIFKNI